MSPPSPPYFTIPVMPIILTISIYFLSSPSISFFPFLTMDEFLASMWSGLSLIENEAATLVIDPKNFRSPKMASLESSR